MSMTTTAVQARGESGSDPSYAFRSSPRMIPVRIESVLQQLELAKQGDARARRKIGGG